MKIRKLLILSLIFASSIVVITTNPVQAENKGHPGIILRHIIYVPDMSIAEKVFKNDAADPFFKQVNEFPKIAESSIYNRYLLNEVSTDFPVPGVNYLSYFGRGMTDEERVKVQNYKSAVLYDFMFPLSAREKSIANASRLVYDIAIEQGGYIWDSETRELFSPAEWKSYRIDSWSDNTPNVKRNTVIHAYKDGEGYRAITLGMAKFGLPDLVINNFDWNDNRSISSLINLTAQQLVEQGLDSFNLKLDIKSLRDSSFKKSLVDSLYENAIRSASISLVESESQDGDPDNFLLEFSFDQYDGKTRYQRQGKLIGSLFGWKDEVTLVKHNAMIEAASKAARQKLPELKARFNAGLETGESLSLKAPFETVSGGNEWMWVEVLRWNEGVIKGILRNVPQNVPTLKEGDEVTIFQDDVFDYIFSNKDGTTEGNKTGELILKFQQR